MKSSLKLSKIAIALSSVICVSASYADIQATNTNTQVFKKSGIEIINIAKPSDSGLSHNQYNKFNVDKSGAVLNNALQNTQSQLAGELAKNPNLNKSANIILNEVVSRSPSTLAGKQEIVGQKADYVLANPNGISCDGCGFINTSRNSLVVGKADVQKGELKGYQVDNNNSLTTKGKVTSAANLDLIAPKVNISGEIESQNDVNVIIGHNRIDRAKDGKLTINVLNKQDQVLDGKVAGSIQAGRIRIHSTNDKGTVAVEGAKLKAKEVAVTAGNTKVNGSITSSQNTSFSSTTEAKRVKLTTTKRNTNQQYQATTIDADTVILGAKKDLEVTGANINANDVTFSSANTHFDTQKTTNTTFSAENRSKGLWFRNETESKSVETVHRTTVSADSIKAVSTEGKLTGEAVKLSAKNIGLHGKQGVDFKGTIETNKQSATADFKNETARLKTGKSSQQATTQNYIASELNSRKHTMLGGSDINLRGVKSQIDGDFVIKTAGKTTIGAETTQNSYVVEDAQKFWGGLAGAKSLASNTNNVVQNGSDITGLGKMFIDADNGVQISGSRVVSAKDGLVKAGNGGLVVDSVLATASSQQSDRTGTIFNITKARNSSFINTSTAQGTTLASESNLKLVSDKDVDILGSSISAGGLLDIATLSNINVEGAKNSSFNSKQFAGVNLSAKVEKPTVTLNNVSTIQASLVIAKKLIEGELNVGEALNATAAAVKDNTAFSAQASATVGIYNKNETITNTSHSSAQLNGNNVNLVGKNLTVAGSNIKSATDINLSAKNINVSAQTNKEDAKAKNTSVGITDTVKLTQSGISNTLSVGVNHTNSNIQKQTAQGSQLTAGKDVVINADNLAYQAAKVSAANNIIENAASISHNVANDTVTTNKKTVDTSLSLTTSVNKDKAFTGSVALNASGGRDNSQVTNAQATSLSAGNNIVSNSSSLKDVATQYQAGNTVSLNSTDYNSQAANNSATTDKMNAGAGVKFSATTSDFQTATAAVDVNANYQTEQTASTTAQKGNINAKNIEINAKNVASQSDLTATDKLNVNANTLNFSQANNTASKTAGGFNATVGVSALVIPSAGAAIPAVNTVVSANGANKQSSTAVASSLTANNINLKAKEGATLQATSLNGKESSTISADKVNVNSGVSTAKGAEGNASLSVSVGASKASVAPSASFAVSHENSTVYSPVAVNGKTVTIEGAKGISLAGVSSESQTLNLATQNGNLDVLAPQSNVKKTSVSASLGLGGGIAENKWTPAKGSASFSTDITRNKDNVESVLTAQKANLNIKGDTLLQGSQINAASVNNQSTGAITTQNTTDKVNKVAVSVSASGGGKATAYTKDKWLDSAIADWNNGTIASVSASADFSTHVVSSATLNSAGINAPKAETLKETKVDIEVGVTSSVPTVVKQIHQAFINQKFPWIVNISSK
ncbi:hypothetical protein A1D22_05495 [Pasteurellaceae bacterium LFhippo2]|nr:hypothetical protein [Pasteurellaceae bacterium LFhippo2]